MRSSSETQWRQTDVANRFWYQAEENILLRTAASSLLHYFTGMGPTDGRPLPEIIRVTYLPMNEVIVGHVSQKKPR